ncbi:MAG: class I SAM-dependent methyltransferase [Pseudomonadota bacterium]|nr:class I SAM-dependent methyltransferase [Pseudomonadota bacterium]
MSDKNDDLSRWYKSKIGKKIAGLERRILMPIVNHFRPFRCLELASSPLICMQSVKEKVNVSSRFDCSVNGVGSCVISDFSTLPFASESFDLVLCVHVHETCRYSGRIIAELSRVLMPEGLVVFIGFNPYGLWRKKDFLLQNSWWDNPMTCDDLMTLAKMCSLEEVYTEYFGYGLGLDEKMVCAAMLAYWRRKWLPSSGVLYKTVVRKRVLAKTSPLLVENAVLENM